MWRGRAVRRYGDFVAGSGLLARCIERLFGKAIGRGEGIRLPIATSRAGGRISGDRTVSQLSRAAQRRS